MSYIWVYDNPLIYSNSSTSSSSTYVSYVGYSKTTDVNANGKYTTIQQYNSFLQVNNYIQQQINIFQNTFGIIMSTSDISKDNSQAGYNKTMKQRYYDLLMMQYSFNNIMTQLLQNYYGNDYNNLLKTTSDYFNYREIIENGLYEINGNNNSLNYNTTLLLDSTLYSTVLWIILAICLLYYVFIKI